MRRAIDFSYNSINLSIAFTSETGGELGKNRQPIFFTASFPPAVVNTMPVNVFVVTHLLLYTEAQHTS